MRVVVDNDTQKTRMREFNLVKKSGLPFDEAEDWNVLFQTTDEEGEPVTLLTCHFVQHNRKASL